MISGSMKLASKVALAIAMSAGLLAVACGEDDGVTPVCKGLSDCTYGTGGPPPRDAGSDAEGDDDTDGAVDGDDAAD